MIDPRVGYTQDSFVAMAMVLDLMAATGETLSRLVSKLPRYAMVKDQYPVGQRRDGGTTGSSGPRCHRRVVGPGSPQRALMQNADRRDGLRLDWEDHDVVHVPRPVIPSRSCG